MERVHLRLGEYQDISATEWLAHTLQRLVNEHLNIGEDFLRSLPEKNPLWFPLGRI
jgi:oxalate decarboxylase